MSLPTSDYNSLDEEISEQSVSESISQIISKDTDVSTRLTILETQLAQVKDLVQISSKTTKNNETQIQNLNSVITELKKTSENQDQILSKMSDQQAEHSQLLQELNQRFINSDASSFTKQVNQLQQEIKQFMQIQEEKREELTSYVDQVSISMTARDEVWPQNIEENIKKQLNEFEQRIKRELSEKTTTETKEKPPVEEDFNTFDENSDFSDDEKAQKSFSSFNENELSQLKERLAKIEAELNKKTVSTDNSELISRIEQLESNKQPEKESDNNESIQKAVNELRGKVIALEENARSMTNIVYDQISKVSTEDERKHNAKIDELENRINSLESQNKSFDTTEQQQAININADNKYEELENRVKAIETHDDQQKYEELENRVKAIETHDDQQKYEELENRVKAIETHDDQQKYEELEKRLTILEEQTTKQHNKYEELEKRLKLLEEQNNNVSMSGLEKLESLVQTDNIPSLSPQNDNNYDKLENQIRSLETGSDNRYEEFDNRLKLLEVHNDNEKFAAIENRLKSLEETINDERYEDLVRQIAELRNIVNNQQQKSEIVEEISNTEEPQQQNEHEPEEDGSQDVKQNSDINELEARIKQQQETIDNIVNTFQNESEQYKERVQKLESNITIYEGNYAVLNQELRQAESFLSELETKVSQFTRPENIQQQITEIEDRIKRELSEKAENQEKSLSQAQRDLEERLQKLESEVSKPNQQLITLTERVNEIGDIEDRLHKLELANVAGVTANQTQSVEPNDESSTPQNVDLSAVFAKFEEIQETARQRVKEIKETFETKESADKLEQRLQNIENQQKELVQYHEFEESQVFAKELQQSFEDLKEHITNKVTQLSELLNQIDKHNEALKIENAKFKDKVTDIEEQQEKQTESLKSLREIESRLSTLKQQNDSFNKQLVDLEARITHQENESNTISQMTDTGKVLSHVAKLSSNVNNLTKSIGTIEMKAKGVEQKFREMQEDYEQTTEYFTEQIKHIKQVAANVQSSVSVINNSKLYPIERQIEHFYKLINEKPLIFDEQTGEVIPQAEEKAQSEEKPQSEPNMLMQKVEGLDAKINSNIDPRIAACEVLANKAIKAANSAITMYIDATNAPRDEKLVSLSVAVAQCQKKCKDLELILNSTKNRTEIFSMLKQRMDYFDQLISARNKADEQHETKLLERQKQLTNAYVTLQVANKRIGQLTQENNEQNKLINDLSVKIALLEQKFQQMSEFNEGKETSLIEKIDSLEEKLASVPGVKHTDSGSEIENEPNEPEQVPTEESNGPLLALSQGPKPRISKATSQSLIDYQKLRALDMRLQELEKDKAEEGVLIARNLSDMPIRMRDDSDAIKRKLDSQQQQLNDHQHLLDDFSQLRQPNRSQFFAAINSSIRQIEDELSKQKQENTLHFQDIENAISADKANKFQSEQHSMQQQDLSKQFVDSIDKINDISQQMETVRTSLDALEKRFFAVEKRQPQSPGANQKEIKQLRDIVDRHSAEISALQESEPVQQNVEQPLNEAKINELQDKINAITQSLLLIKDDSSSDEEDEEENKDDVAQFAKTVQKQRQKISDLEDVVTSLEEAIEDMQDKEKESDSQQKTKEEIAENSDAIEKLKQRVSSLESMLSGKINESEKSREAESSASNGEEIKALKNRLENVVKEVKERLSNYQQNQPKLQKDSPQELENRISKLESDYEESQRTMQLLLLALIDEKSNANMIFKSNSNSSLSSLTDYDYIEEEEDDDDEEEGNNENKKPHIKRVRKEKAIKERPQEEEIPIQQQINDNIKRLKYQNSTQFNDNAQQKSELKSLQDCINSLENMYSEANQHINEQQNTIGSLQKEIESLKQQNTIDSLKKEIETLKEQKESVIEEVSTPNETTVQTVQPQIIQQNVVPDDINEKLQSIISEQEESKHTMQLLLDALLNDKKTEISESELSSLTDYDYIEEEEYDDDEEGNNENKKPHIKRVRKEKAIKERPTEEEIPIQQQINDNIKRLKYQNSAQFNDNAQQKSELKSLQDRIKEQQNTIDSLKQQIDNQQNHESVIEEVSAQNEATQQSAKPEEAQQIVVPDDISEKLEALTAEHEETKETLQHLIESLFSGNKGELSDDDLSSLTDYEEEEDSESDQQSGKRAKRQKDPKLEAKARLNKAIEKLKTGAENAHQRSMKQEKQLNSIIPKIESLQKHHSDFDRRISSEVLTIQQLKDLVTRNVGKIGALEKEQEEQRQAIQMLLIALDDEAEEGLLDTIIGNLEEESETEPEKPQNKSEQEIQTEEPSNIEKVIEAVKKLMHQKENAIGERLAQTEDVKQQLENIKSQVKELEEAQEKCNNEEICRNKLLEERLQSIEKEIQDEGDVFERDIQLNDGEFEPQTQNGGRIMKDKAHIRFYDNDPDIMIIDQKTPQQQNQDKRKQMRAKFIQDAKEVSDNVKKLQQQNDELKQQIEEIRKNTGHVPEYVPDQSIQSQIDSLKEQHEKKLRQVYRALKEKIDALEEELGLTDDPIFSTRDINFAELGGAEEDQHDEATQTTGQTQPKQNILQQVSDMQKQIDEISRQKPSQNEEAQQTSDVQQEIEKLKSDLNNLKSSLDDKLDQKLKVLIGKPSNQQTTLQLVNAQVSKRLEEFTREQKDTEKARMDDLRKQIQDNELSEMRQNTAQQISDASNEVKMLINANQEKQNNENQQIEERTQELEKQLQQRFATLDKRLETHQKGALEREKALDERVTAFDSKYHDNLIELQNKVLSVEQSENRIEEGVKSELEKSQQQMKQLEQKLKAETDRLSTQFMSQITDLENEMKQNEERNKLPRSPRTRAGSYAQESSIMSTRDLDSELLDRLNESEEHSKENMTQLRSQLEDRLNDALNELEEKRNEIEESVRQMNDALADKVRELTENSESQLREFADKQNAQNEELQNRIDTQMRQIAEENGARQKQNEAKIQNLVKDVTAQSQNAANELSSKFGAKLSELSSQLENLSQRIDDAKDETQAALKAQEKQTALIIDEIDQAAGEQIGLLLVKQAQLRQQINRTAQEMNSKLRTELKNQEKKIVDKANEVVQLLDQQTQQNNEKLKVFDQRITLSDSKLSDRINAVDQRITSSELTHNEHMSQLEQRVNKLDSTTADKFAFTEKQIADSVQAVNAKLSAQKESTDEKLLEIESQIESRNRDTEQSLKQAISESAAKLDSAIERTDQSLTDELDALSRDTDERLQKLDAQLQQLKQQTNTSDKQIVEKVTQVTQNLTQIIQDQALKSRQKRDELDQKLQQRIQQLDEKTTKRISQSDEKLQQQLQQSAKTLQAKLTDDLNQSIERQNAQNKETADAVQEIEQQLKSLDLRTTDRVNLLGDNIASYDMKMGAKLDALDKKHAKQLSDESEALRSEMKDNFRVVREQVTAECLKKQNDKIEAVREELTDELQKQRYTLSQTTQKLTEAINSTVSAESEKLQKAQLQATEDSKAKFAQLSETVKENNSNALQSIKELEKQVADLTRDVKEHKEQNEKQFASSEKAISKIQNDQNTFQTHTNELLSSSENKLQIRLQSHQKQIADNKEDTDAKIELLEERLKERFSQLKSANAQEMRSFAAKQQEIEGSLNRRFDSLNDTVTKGLNTVLENEQETSKKLKEQSQSIADTETSVNKQISENKESLNKRIDELKQLISEQKENVETTISDQTSADDTKFGNIFQRLENAEEAHREIQQHNSSLQREVKQLRDDLNAKIDSENGVTRNFLNGALSAQTQSFSSELSKLNSKIQQISSEPANSQSTVMHADELNESAGSEEISATKAAVMAEVTKLTKEFEEFRVEQLDTKATIEASTTTVDKFIREFETRIQELTTKLYLIDRKVASIFVHLRLSPTK